MLVLLLTSLPQYPNVQVILYICIFVWLINYHHFLSWKTLPNSWLPDPSTIQFSLAKATFYFKVRLARQCAAEAVQQAALDCVGTLASLSWVAVLVQPMVSNGTHSDCVVSCLRWLWPWL